MRLSDQARMMMFSPPTTLFVKTSTLAVRLDDVVRADFSRMEELVVLLVLRDGSGVEATGIDAIDAAMLIKPSALEGRRMRWPKWMWFVHNMLGHPVMQLLALVGAPRWGMWVHDATVPRPVGRYERAKRVS